MTRYYLGYFDCQDVLFYVLNADRWGRGQLDKPISFGTMESLKEYIQHRYCISYEDSGFIAVEASCLSPG